MCINPIKIKIKDPTNKYDELEVPCGHCIICRNKRAQAWAIRLINECRYYKDASHITLTFDNKILHDKESKAVKKFGAKNNFVWSIDNSKDYVTKFLKRLRKKLNKNIKYFLVGEYGEKNKRPHYHLIIFGENFQFDRKTYRLSKSGKKQFFSETLNDLWACGITTIQDINENNIQYVSQYTLKKWKDRENRYKEKIRFSNRGKFNKFVRRNASIILNKGIKTKDGKFFSVPKNYINEIKKAAEKNEISGSQKYKYIFEEYGEKMDEYLEKFDREEYIKKNKAKAEILKAKCKEKLREF